MAYISATDILNFIDANNLAAMCNDWDPTLPITSPNASAQLSSICQLASNMADSYVASIYPTPFDSSAPKTIYAATVIFACEMLYFRRNSVDEQNPFKAQANTWRDRLQKIGAGELPLDESFRRGFTPVVYSTHKTRLNSSIY